MPTCPARPTAICRSVAAGVLIASLSAGVATAGAASATPPAASPAAAATAPATAAPPTAAPTPASGPQAVDPAPAPTAIPLAYGVDGDGELRTGIRGKVAISGTFVGAYDPASGAVAGAFKLTPTQARVTALGFFPVVADTDWIFTEPVTGTWKDGVLRLRIAVKIHHPKLAMFGVQVAGGASCATKEPSIIELRSEGAGTSNASGPTGSFTLTQIAPGFRISVLSGCGPLDGFLSAVAAGGGNRASLKFSSLPAS